VLSDLKDAYKTIYRSDRNISQAVIALKERVKTDAGRAVLAFVEAESPRGIMK
jgi:acyl-[acyl carrier protein]--UDP-N-acetylglucosamine O-acyltransferase